MDDVTFRKAIDSLRCRVSVTAKRDEVLLTVSEKRGPEFGQMFISAEAALPLYRLLGLYLDERNVFMPSPSPEPHK